MTNDALDLNGVYAVSLHGTSSSKCELVSLQVGMAKWQANIFNRDQTNDIDP